MRRTQTDTGREKKKRDKANELMLHHKGHSEVALAPIRYYRQF